MRHDGLELPVMAGFTCAAILILAFTIFLNPQNTVQTRPNISVRQAIQTVELDLKSRIPGFQNITIWSGYNRTYISASAFESKNFSVSLFYQHPNGTLFLVDASSRKAIHTCNNT